MLLIALDMGAHKEDNAGNVRRLTWPEKTEIEWEREARNRTGGNQPDDKQHTCRHAERHCKVMTPPGGGSIGYYGRVIRRTTKGHQQSPRRELVEDGNHRRTGDGPPSIHRATRLEVKHVRELSELEASDNTPSRFRATGEGMKNSSSKPTEASNSRTAAHVSECGCKRCRVLSSAA
eukprot:4337757-Pleurochrysis_carterae.AAC.1